MKGGGGKESGILTQSINEFPTSIPLPSPSPSRVIGASKSYLILNDWSGDTGMPEWGNIDEVVGGSGPCWRSRGFGFGGISLRGNGGGWLHSFSEGSKGMRSPAFEVFLLATLFGIEEGLGKQVGRNRMVRSIVDSGGSSLEAVQLVDTGVNVVNIFGCGGVARGDWDLDVPVEAARNRIVRLCGGDRFGNMPTVRSIYPSFLETLIFTVLLNGVVGFLLDGGAVEFGLGFFLLPLLLGNVFVFASDARKDTSLFNRCDILNFIGFSFSIGIPRSIETVFYSTCNSMERLYFMVVDAVNNLAGWLVGDKSWLRDGGALLQLDGNFSVVVKGIVNPLTDDVQRVGDFVLMEAILWHWGGRRRGYESPQDGESQCNSGRAMPEPHCKEFVGLRKSGKG